VHFQAGVATFFATKSLGSIDQKVQKKEDIVLRIFSLKANFMGANFYGHEKYEKDLYFRL